MPTRLTGLQIRRVSVVPKGANQEAHLVLFKRDTTEDDMAGKVQTVEEQLAELTAKVATLTKAKSDADEARLKAEAEAKKAADAKKSAEDIAKEQKDAVEVLQKQATQAQERVTKLEDEIERQRYLKIAAEVPHLGAPDDAAPQLRTIAKALGDEGFKAWLQKQKAFAAQLQGSGLLKETGSGNGDTGDSPTAKLDTMARTYAKEKGVPFEKAYAVIIKSDEGKALYTQHRNGGQ